jgi:hypothetical protein
VDDVSNEVNGKLSTFSVIQSCHCKSLLELWTWAVK